MSLYYIIENPMLGFYTGLKYGRPQFEKVALRRHPKVVKYKTNAAAYKDLQLIKRLYATTIVTGPFLGPDNV